MTHTNGLPFGRPKRFSFESPKQDRLGDPNVILLEWAKCSKSTKNSFQMILPTGPVWFTQTVPFGSPGRDPIWKTQTVPFESLKGDRRSPI